MGCPCRSADPWQRSAGGSPTLPRLKRHFRRAPQTLFLGISDGARLDTLRRVNVGIIRNEQVVPTIEFDDARWASLTKDLRKDLGQDDAKFRFIFLVDDFTGSGLTFLRRDADGAWTGKLAQSWKSVKKRIENGSVADDFQLVVHHYLASADAERRIPERADEAASLLLEPAVQHKKLREKATHVIQEWDFPRSKQVRKLIDALAASCLRKTLEPNAPLGAGANAYGIPQHEFDAIPDQYPELALLLQAAIANNAVTVVPRHTCKNKEWCLLELGGIVILRHGLTLKRGGSSRAPRRRSRRLRPREHEPAMGSLHLARCGCE